MLKLVPTVVSLAARTALGPLSSGADAATFEAESGTLGSDWKMEIKLGIYLICDLTVDSTIGSGSGMLYHGNSTAFLPVKTVIQSMKIQSVFWRNGAVDSPIGTIYSVRALSPTTWPAMEWPKSLLPFK